MNNRSLIKRLQSMDNRSTIDHEQNEPKIDEQTTKINGQSVINPSTVNQKWISKKTHDTTQ